MTHSQDSEEIQRDARWEKRLIYKALISFAVVATIVVIRELLLR